MDMSANPILSLSGAVFPQDRTKDNMKVDNPYASTGVTSQRASLDGHSYNEKQSSDKSHRIGNPRQVTKDR